MSEREYERMIDYYHDLYELEHQSRLATEDELNTETERRSSRPELAATSEVENEQWR